MSTVFLLLVLLSATYLVGFHHGARVARKGYTPIGAPSKLPQAPKGGTGQSSSMAV